MTVNVNVFVALCILALPGIFLGAFWIAYVLVGLALAGRDALRFLVGRRP